MTHGMEKETTILTSLLVTLLPKLDHMSII